LLNEETMDRINAIIEKHEKEPFLRWNYNLKMKLRYNFAEDSKRTWNKIKMTAILPSEIKPEPFCKSLWKKLVQLPSRIEYRRIQ
jgi:hypothetical protein